MRLTCWWFHNTGNKITSHIRGEGIVHRDWPKRDRVPPVDGHGMGYGVLAGAKKAWQVTESMGFHWLYGDGPYFVRRKGMEVRLAWDGQWYIGGPDREVKSLEEKGVHLKPWKKDRGEIVYVCPSNHPMHEVGYGNDAERWAEETRHRLREHTDRQIEVRWKENASGASDVRAAEMEKKVFEKAWAIVTHGSTIGCEALAYGLPVFSCMPCALRAHGRRAASLGTQSSGQAIRQRRAS